MYFIHVPFHACHRTSMPPPTSHTQCKHVPSMNKRQSLAYMAVKEYITWLYPLILVTGCIIDENGCFQRLDLDAHRVLISVTTNCIEKGDEFMACVFCMHQPGRSQ